MPPGGARGCSEWCWPWPVGPLTFGFCRVLGLPKLRKRNRGISSKCQRIEIPERHERAGCDDHPTAAAPPGDALHSHSADYEAIRNRLARPVRAGEGSCLVVAGWLKNYFAPRIASLAALATRNLTTRLAAIWMVSPVAGWRPIRALRLTRTSLPSPGRVKVFLAFF